MRLQHQFNQTKPLASWEALICLALWKHFCLRVFWGEFSPPTNPPSDIKDCSIS